MKAVKEILKNEKIKFVGAVKPKGNGGEISHFLLEGGRLIKFQKKGVFEILQDLRDEAHLPANAARRRRRREMSVFF